jgi:hypothetical protein
MLALYWDVKYFIRNPRVRLATAVALPRTRNGIHLYCVRISEATVMSWVGNFSYITVIVYCVLKGGMNLNLHATAIYTIGSFSGPH